MPYAYVLLLLLAGCGVSVPPLVQQEISSDLVKPAWPVAKEGFNLTGSSDLLDMKGSVLIWDEAITAENVEFLSSASLNKKRQSASYERVVHFINAERQRLSTRLPEIEAQQQRVRELSSAAYARARAANPGEWRLRQQERWTKGAGWLPAQFAELAALDTAWDRKHTDDVLRAYCEGKIFALAVNENFLRRSFLQRPTAHIMCESYQQELFADKPACQNAGDAQGRDYFQCIWLHGVLASNYFAENYASVEGQQEKIATLRQLLNSDPQRFKQSILATYENVAKRRYLKQYQRLGRIGFGDRSVTIRPRKGQAFILQLVRDVESPAQLEDVASIAVAQHIFTGEAASTAIAEKRNSVIRSLQALAKTVGGISVSDYRFNRDIAVPRLAVAVEGNCVSTGILSKEMEFLCNLRRAEVLLPQILKELPLPLLEEDQLALTGAQQLLASMQREYDSAIDALEKQDLEAFDVYSAALDAAVNAARGENMAQALFTSARLQIVSHADYYEVSFKLLERDGVRFTACFTHARGEQLACPELAADQLQDSNIFRAAYLKAEGRLNLDFALKNPEAIGFDYLSRDSDQRDQDRSSFCDLKREQFQDLRLKIEIYANRFEQLEMMSGSGKFQNAEGETLYEASIGFERELDI